MTRARKPPATIDVFDFRRLREVRKEKGVTSTEIAKNVISNYYAIETGACLPSITVFVEICRYLDLDPFTIAAILRQPCVTPNQWRGLRAISKKLNTTLNQITKEFLNVLHGQNDIPKKGSSS